MLLLPSDITTVLWSTVDTELYTMHSQVIKTQQLGQKDARFVPLLTTKTIILILGIF